MGLLNATIRLHVGAHNRHPSSTQGARNWSPLQKRTDGCLQASQRGMNLNLFPLEGTQDGGARIEELEDDITTWPSEQALADQNRLTASTDPYIQVERYHESLPPLLKDEGFRAALHLSYPPATVHSNTEGPEGTFDMAQYLIIREYVYESLRANPDFV
jgi:hypothetical protein